MIHVVHLTQSTLQYNRTNSNKRGTISNDTRGTFNIVNTTIGQTVTKEEQSKLQKEQTVYKWEKKQQYKRKNGISEVEKNTTGIHTVK